MNPVNKDKVKDESRSACVHVRACVSERVRERESEGGGGREIDILQSSTLLQPQSARACFCAAPCQCVRATHSLTPASRLVLRQRHELLPVADRLDPEMGEEGRFFWL